MTSFISARPCFDGLEYMQKQTFLWCFFFSYSLLVKASFQTDGFKKAKEKK